MKRLTFDNFIPHKSNQGAYNIAREVAGLKPDLPRPIVLLGESGAGKTHLLWATVNHFRDRNSQVRVALISPRDFPDKVKALAADEAKLAAQPPIVLLVDDLHAFDKESADLEKTVLALMDHGHNAVLTTQKHPNVLSGFSGKFKALLNAGAIAGIKALPKAEGTIIPEAALEQILELKSRVSQLQRDKALLEAEKGEVQPSETPPEPEHLKPAPADDSALRSELEQVMQQLRKAEGEAEAWKEAASAMMKRVESYKALQQSQLSSIEEQIAEVLSFADQALLTLDEESLRNANAELAAILAKSSAEHAAALQGEGRKTLHSLAEQFKELKDPPVT
ncbi:MAG: hypothetical protein GX130_02970 [Candidatus Hydrogenedens sp.]|jgi:ABC-type sulfate/molybdate transport systems ATPase subunit|nr:hypothetical protein [Candidatus Hydrogenedens sp.]